MEIRQISTDKQSKHYNKAGKILENILNIQVKLLNNC